MAICASGETLLQEATGIRRGRAYPVVKKYLQKVYWRYYLVSLLDRLLRVDLIQWV